jgi:hypothetical protein
MRMSGRNPKSKPFNPSNDSWQAYQKQASVHAYEPANTRDFLRSYEVAGSTRLERATYLLLETM